MGDGEEQESRGEKRKKMALLFNLPWVGKSLSITADQSFKETNFGEERRLHRNEGHRKKERWKGEKKILEGKNEE